MVTDINCKSLFHTEKIWLSTMFCLSFSQSYQLMAHCWTDNFDARPTFTELCQDLEDWMLADTDYLDVNKVNENEPYYDTSVVSASSGSSWEHGESESGSDSKLAAEN